MFDANVYYCWGCDAHRRVIPRADGQALCPDCGRELPPDSQLRLCTIPGESIGAGPVKVWAAPIRPRLAASA
jgi:predicted amidophosphoribosyltransferase